MQDQQWYLNLNPLLVIRPLCFCQLMKTLWKIRPSCSRNSASNSVSAQLWMSCVFMRKHVCPLFLDPLWLARFRLTFVFCFLTIWSLRFVAEKPHKLLHWSFFTCTFLFVFYIFFNIVLCVTEMNWVFVKSISRKILSWFLKHEKPHCWSYDIQCNNCIFTTSWTADLRCSELFDFYWTMQTQLVSSKKKKKEILNIWLPW